MKFDNLRSLFGGKRNSIVMGEVVANFATKVSFNKRVLNSLKISERIYSCGPGFFVVCHGKLLLKYLELLGETDIARLVFYSIKKEDIVVDDDYEFIYDATLNRYSFTVLGDRHVKHMVSYGQYNLWGDQEALSFVRHNSVSPSSIINLIEKHKNSIPVFLINWQNFKSEDHNVVEIYDKISSIEILSFENVELIGKLSRVKENLVGLEKELINEETKKLTTKHIEIAEKNLNIAIERKEKFEIILQRLFQILEILLKDEKICRDLKYYSKELMELTNENVRMDQKLSIYDTSLYDVAYVERLFEISQEIVKLNSEDRMKTLTMKSIQNEEFLRLFIQDLKQNQQLLS